MFILPFAYLPALLIALIFVNRYVVGALVRGKRKSKAVWETLPSVTVLVPVYNEGESVYRTLHSLAAQDYPSELVRIHAIDDASGTETTDALRRALAEIPNLTVTFHERNQGKRQNLIEATREATSDFVMSVDSDCLIVPGALRSLVDSMAPGIDAVGGVVRVSNPDVNFLTRVQTVKYWVGYEFLKGLEDTFDKVMCLSGCITLYRREVLVEVEPALMARNFLGGDVRYGEDRYLTRQIVQRGHRTRLCRDAICYTKVPETFANWFSQQLRWRRSNLVDFLGGFWQAHRLPLPVAIHYTALGCLLFTYPVAVVMAFMGNNVFLPMAAQASFCALLCAGYIHASLTQDNVPRVDPIGFLTLPAILMVSYLTITPLALMTLVTKRWETRSAPK